MTQVGSLTLGASHYTFRLPFLGLNRHVWPELEKAEPLLTKLADLTRQINLNFKYFQKMIPNSHHHRGSIPTVRQELVSIGFAVPATNWQHPKILLLPTHQCSNMCPALPHFSFSMFFQNWACKTEIQPKLEVKSGSFSRLFSIQPEILECWSFEVCNKHGD